MLASWAAQLTGMCLDIVTGLIQYFTILCFLDLQQSIQFPTSTTSTTNIQSLSSDQQHHSSSPSK